METLKEDERGAGAVAFSSDGRVLASGNSDGTIDLWDVATRKRIDTLAAHAGLVARFAFSPDGAALASSSWQDHDVKVWDVASRQLKHVLSGHTDKVGSVEFSPNGNWIASASSDTTVKLWDADTGRLVRSFSNPDRMFGLAFSPDGKRLAAGGFFQTVRIWDRHLRKSSTTSLLIGRRFAP